MHKVVGKRLHIIDFKTKVDQYTRELIFEYHFPNSLCDKLRKNNRESNTQTQYFPDTLCKIQVFFIVCKIACHRIGLPDFILNEFSKKILI